MVYRVYSEKKPGLSPEVASLRGDCRNFLGIAGLEDVRILNRYDAEGLDEALFNYARTAVFSEPQLDIVSEVAEFPGATIVGCDGAQEALAIARNLAPMVTFEVANIYEMPYEDKEFDLIVCSEVLEHLNNPKAALTELNRVGKSLLITVPHEPWFRLGNLASLHNVARLGDPIDHINHWTFSGFKMFISTNLKRNCYFDKSFPWSILLVK